MTEFHRLMGAWGGNPAFESTGAEKMKNKKIGATETMITITILSLAIIAGLTYRVIIINKRLDAYQKISEAMGVVRVSPTDGKRYVSFALKANQNAAFQGEAPDFLAALDSIKYIGDIRGINLDRLKITQESLNRLSNIETLEVVYARETTLNDTDISGWKSRPAQSGKPPVKVITTY